ncbi:macro domain-containing protein [Haemophilus parahaemolyticus]|uniref:macro domain-containing protein n=1 Tax=Haemophilus parahaemolyticus TaxID=735 RepID=UPI0028CFFDD1|nr:macro domain-containing protein [Haemophilus parahaemolyticus]
MIEFKKGNIFSTQSDVVVNAVNCVGVMGAGIALEFKLRFPDMFSKYQNFCKSGALDIGKLWLYSIPNSKSGFSKILNFPTKRDWKQSSKIEFIEDGLSKFVHSYENKSINSIAFPYLGAGKGSLSSEISLEIMEKYLSNLPIYVEIWEYDPSIIDNTFFQFRDYLLSLEPLHLAKLSGVNKDKILILRELLINHSYKNLSELSKIKGIGVATIQKLFNSVL